MEAGLTPEHAAKVAGQYDKTKDMLDTYKKGLPEGEDVFKNLKDRADKLGVGRDSPILSAIAGFGGAAAVGAATGNGPASSIAGAFAAEQAGKGMKALDRVNRTRILGNSYAQ